MLNNTSIKKRIFIYQNKILLNNKKIIKHEEAIKLASSKYHVDIDILYNILLIEYTNRGDFFTRNIERLLAKYCSAILVNRDASVGIGQIKISTAKELFPQENEKTVLKNLLKNDFNITVCAILIGKYTDYLKKEQKNNLFNLVKLYTTGSINSDINLSLITYYKLLKWAINKNLMSSNY